MRNHSMVTLIFFFFFVFLVCHMSIATSTPAYVADDNIALNCGTSGNSTARDQRVWIGDKDSIFAPIEEPNHKSTNSEAKSQDYIDAVPYKTARISSSQFTYVFPVNRPGPKFVRLHFYQASYSGFDNSKDFFTVKAGSFTLLRNFSASLAKSSDGSSLSKEFCINVEEGKKLDVQFIPSPSNSGKFYAFINGIEIVSMPNDLYYGPEGAALPYVSQGSQFAMDHKMALEKVVRLNVGGGVISPRGDTGMFREWSQDDNYTLGGGVTPVETFLKPRYTMIRPYTAPDDIYRTAVSMGPNTSKNLLSNLTWLLRVDSGFNYLVRLHFCEIQAGITEVGERPFIIYIDNKTADDKADVLLWSKRNETPVYKDYVVWIQNNGVQDKVDLFVALHPRKFSFAINDAILNGMEVFKLSNSADNLAVAGPDPESVLPPPPGQQSVSTTSESNAKKTIIIAIGSGAGFLVVLTLVCCMLLWGLSKTKRYGPAYGSYHPILSKCWCWLEPDKGKSTRTTASSLPEELCRHFSLDEIKTATHNFHEELIIGAGGFGSVYKGFVDEGMLIVAIKRLNPESKQGLREFWTEIEMLSLLRHVHLVSLIGFCNEEGEMILVYDYMTNGTLRHHLYDTQNDPLSWKQRLNICIGTASGLDYLHTGGKQPIIHRDVKTNNILLDKKWVAKVSDFGLSKMGKENTAVSTFVKGTPGYLDPDYFKRHKLTEKSDVYSFGVVLFEVLCARKAQDQKLETEQCHLAKWAQKCIERGTIGEIIDPYLKGKIAFECFKTYVEVAKSCVLDQANQRPTMNDVMEKLRFALELQENADAAKEKMNSGGDHRYPEVLSFSGSGSIGIPRNNNVASGHVLEMDSGTGFTTTNTGLTCPSLDSGITSQDVLTNTTNSKA